MPTAVKMGDIDDFFAKKDKKKRGTKVRIKNHFILKISHIKSSL